jgi:hypothetical protein
MKQARWSGIVALMDNPQRTADEQQLVDRLEHLKGRPLTEAEVNLALEQARALGYL